MNAHLIEHAYSDADALAGAVADALQAACDDALAARGHALLALAGGRTPLPAYARLAGRPVDWAHVVAFPTDERLVAHEDPACNLHELRQVLATAGGLRLESLTTRDGDPAASLQHALDRLAVHAGPFDAVVLGMGADTHTASLFPGAPQLAAAFAPDAADACRIDPRPPPPEAPYPRISLSASRLLRARTLHLVITGDAKREALARALASADDLRHPIAALLRRAQAPAHLHWSP